MGKALYRKYRSKSLAEIVGQEHIVTTLQNAIKSGKLSHAYLFTGPRGVGKTSIARILAHEINELPYGDEQLHLDIIEIDAASNRRIDEIRDLRDKVHTAPISAKYKVYIIDEVHMLTREAFNALLKTLEEPPAHCIFILATTELHKVPPTIISRTQRYNFQPIDADSAAAHLRTIADKEKIKIDDEALKLLAIHGEGSFRDSISLLDQLSSSTGTIDAQSVADMLGLPPTDTITKLAEAVVSRDSGLALMQLLALQEQGYGAARIAGELSKVLRAALSKETSSRLVVLLRNLLDVAASPNPQAALELAVLEACAVTDPPADAPAKVAATEVALAPTISIAAKPAKQNHHVQPPAKAKVTETAEPKVVKTAPPPSKVQSPSSTIALSYEDWPALLGLSKQRAASLYTALRLAQPTFGEAGDLTLAFQFPLHQKKVNEERHKRLIIEFADQLERSVTEISCIVDKSIRLDDQRPLVVEEEPAATLEPASQAVSSESLVAISNIFGTAEVLES